MVKYDQKGGLEHSELIFKSGCQGLEDIVNVIRSLLNVLYGVPDLL